MSKVKGKIIEILRATKRDHMEDVIGYMEQGNFFIRGCHHHHHYGGGLADHAWQTYLIAIRTEEEYCKRHPDHQKVDAESLALCCLLHDFCNCHGMNEIVGHGRRSAKMLQALGLHLSGDEYLAIRFHMGLGNKENHPNYEDAKHSHLSALVHNADKASASMRSGSEID